MPQPVSMIKTADRSVSVIHRGTTTADGRGEIGGATRNLQIHRYINNYWYRTGLACRISKGSDKIEIMRITDERIRRLKCE